MAWGRVSVLALLGGLLLLDGGLVAAAITAFAVMPARTAGGFLIGLNLMGRLAAVKAFSAVEGIQLILLDDVDEFSGIVDILGIAAVPESLCPAAVIGDIEFVENAVAWPLQKLGMVEERILGGAILAVAHGVAQGVPLAIDFTLPMVGLDAEVVVSLLCHAALAGIALQDALGKRDAGGYSELHLILECDGFITFDIIQIILSCGL